MDPRDDKSERERGEPGAERPDSESEDAFSGRPAEDDAPVGDTDQISDAKHA